MSDQPTSLPKVFFRQIICMAQLAKSAVCRNMARTELPPEDVSVDMVGVAPVSDSEEEEGSAAEAKEHDEDDDDNNVPRTRSKEKRSRQVMSIKTANAADDYAHRGVWLKDFHFLGYQMYVKRVPLNHCDGHVWPFEQHYVLASRFGQQIRSQAAVPRLCNFNCPSEQQNAEENALMKSLLLVPIRCPGQGFCHHVCRFNPLLGLEGTPDVMQRGRMTQRASFLKAWRVHWRKIRQAAQEADELEQSAGKLLVLKDTVLFKTWASGSPEQQEANCCAVRLQVSSVLLNVGLSDKPVEIVMLFLCAREIAQKGGHECGDAQCLSLSWGHHAEQCTVFQFMSQLAATVALNLDLSAESKSLKKAGGPQIPDDEDTGPASVAQGEMVL